MPLPHSRVTLDNGLDVLVHEDHECPIVAVNIWYHVGSKNETPGHTGFAHLFEHLMFEGSEHHDKGYFQPLQEAGGTLTARPTPTAPTTGRSSRRMRWSWRCGWSRTAWGTCCRR